MAVLLYGCDCSFMSGKKLLGKSLGDQKDALCRALGDKFDLANWYADAGNEIVVPFLQRPAAVTLLCRARAGDEIWCDVPERVLGQSREANKVLDFLKDSSLTLRSTLHGFSFVSPVDVGVVGRRYAQMIREINASLPQKRNERAGVPVGWKLAGSRLVPDIRERVMAMLIYEAMIDHGILSGEINKLFRTDHKATFMARAFELQFPIETEFIKTRPVIPVDGPSIPNVKHMLHRLAYSPMSIREMAAYCNMTPIEAYLIVTRGVYMNCLSKSVRGPRKEFTPDRRGQKQLITSIEFIELRNSHRLRQSKMNMMSGTERNLGHVGEIGTLVCVPEYIRKLLVSEPELIDWDSIADAINGISSSGRIFHGLDGVADPEPLEICELDEPAPDRPDIPPEPSHQQDQEQGPDAEEAELPPPSP